MNTHNSNLDHELKTWETFYRKYFKIELNVSSLDVPPHKDGYNKLLVIAPDLMVDQVYDVCSQNFACKKEFEETLEVAIITNTRNPMNGGYAIWVMEDDSDYEKPSVLAIGSYQSMQAETLLERLIHELKFYNETGTFCISNTADVCAGSRDAYESSVSLCRHEDVLFIRIHAVSPPCFR